MTLGATRHGERHVAGVTPNLMQPSIHHSDERMKPDASYFANAISTLRPCKMSKKPRAETGTDCSTLRLPNGGLMSTQPSAYRTLTPERSVWKLRESQSTALRNQCLIHSRTLQCCASFHMATHYVRPHMC